MCPDGAGEALAQLKCIALPRASLHLVYAEAVLQMHGGELVNAPRTPDGGRPQPAEDAGHDAAGDSATRATEDVGAERPLEELGPGDGAPGRSGGPPHCPPPGRRVLVPVPAE